MHDDVIVADEKGREGKGRECGDIKGESSG
jgi:hypothetical protein